MSKAVRLSDIAARIGVSTVTVSKALSGQKGMSDEVRARILEAAQEMGYVKGAARRSGAEKRTGFRIGLLVAERYLGKYVSFYAHLQQLVAAEIAAKDCVMLLEGVPLESETGAETPGIIGDGLCDGVIVLGKVAPQYLKMLEKLGTSRNLDAIADSCAMSRSGFFAKFRSTFGTTPAKYREQQVLTQAQALLEDTDLSIKEIARELNMGSPGYFSTRFKKAFGVSPRDHRRKFRADDSDAPAP